MSATRYIFCRAVLLAYVYDGKRQTQFGRCNLKTKVPGVWIRMALRHMHVSKRHPFSILEAKSQSHFPATPLVKTQATTTTAAHLQWLGNRAAARECESLPQIPFLREKGIRCYPNALSASIPQKAPRLPFAFRDPREWETTQ